MPDHLAQVATDYMNGLLADGLIAAGAQVSVIQAGSERLQLAFGRDHRGAPLTPAHASCLYCCSKVPIFTVLLAAIDAGLLQLDTTLGRLLPDANDWVGEATVAELLSQRGGFAVLEGPVSRFVPEQLRRTCHHWLTESAKAPRGTQAYAVSEVGWLVALIAERGMGRHYGELVPQVTAQVLGPDVLRTENGPLWCTYQQVEGRAPVPLLNELTAVVRRQWNPSLGWYAPAAALARYGAALSAAWNGRTALGAAVVREATRPFAPATFDVGLQRDASFGLGFWTGLAGHGFGEAGSASSFGHSAQGGSSFMFVDPERDLSVAGCFDIGLPDDTGLGARRAPFISAIVEAVDG